ncbi:hypothetical protein RA307_30380 [Xanthobacteraceae bacterium Astr-EGSB]|uniref:hypothetical protein n=1 Tax=Astrobacterium formosum TaxID=3069710 RepID=UPI0027AEB503|nr:hypothetical protein [Xanthobacteraceae bacterium Astr-EGSB]
MSQQPSRGGSYVQDKDGALKRIAFTAVEETSRVREVAGTTPQAEPVAKTQSVAPAKGRKSKE